MSITIAKAQKNDTITLYNGDRITCEVKNLSKGKLYVKTSDMQKIYIKWSKVAHIETLKEFEVVLDNHDRYIGEFSKKFPGIVRITFEKESKTLSLITITNFTQINASFWKQLTGNANAGFVYQNNNNSTQINASGVVKHRSERFQNTIEYDALISSDDTQLKNKRQSVGYILQGFLKKSIFTIYNVSWEQNTDLGIKNRGLINARIGYSPVDNNVNLLDISVGLLFNREHTNENLFTNNIESIIDITYDFFIFTKPNIDLTTNIVAYSSFTVKDRFRVDYSFRTRWEIINNFTINLNYYFFYDNKPPSENASNFSYSINTSFGYTF